MTKPNTELKARMAAAGYHTEHTGGGCMAWEKFSTDNYASIWLGSDDTLGETEADKFTVMLQNQDGEFANGPDAVSLDEALAWADNALANYKTFLESED